MNSANQSVSAMTILTMTDWPTAGLTEETKKELENM
jgi:hypothetical protein